MKNEDIASRIGDIERKLSDGEALFRRVGNAERWGWFFLSLGVLLIIIGLFRFLLISLFGLVMLGASIWRLYTTDKYKKEIEKGLREYRGQKAELQARLSMTK